MLTPQDWYSADRAVEFLVTVALGVLLLSTAAWVAAWRLPKQPAVRHLVLLSALLGCLGMPILAAVFVASGLRLISLPILPVGPVATDSSDAFAKPQHLTPPRHLADDLLPSLADHQAETGTSPRARSDPAGIDSRQAIAAIPSPAEPVPAVTGLGHPRAARHAGWGFLYRATATMLLMGWGCGSVLLLLKLTRSCLFLRRLRRSLTPLRDASLLRLRDDVVRALEMRQIPDILLSRRVLTPLAFGLHRPAVVLPERLIDAVSDEEMRDVLLHEMAHLSRRDPLVVLLQAVARALYWPIPTAHALIRALRRAGEELCDNYVLRGRDALSYGATLLHLAELSQQARPLPLAVSILHWSGELERRIAGLLDHGRSTRTRSSRWLVWIVALLFLAGATIASATRLSAGGAQPERAAASTPEPEHPKTAAAANAAAHEKPKRSMQIHILGPDGKPMSGVQVLCAVWTRTHIEDGNHGYTSDDRGQIGMDLPDGIYILRLFAEAKGHVPLFASWEERDDPETSLPAEFTFRLKRGTVIGGIVINRDGLPIKGVIVDVKLERGGESEGRVGTNGWLAVYDAATHAGAPITDEQGRWTLDNVPPGDDLKLSLKLSHPDYISDPDWGTSQDEQGIDLKALRARTATITMRGGLVLTGTVTDPEGKPVAGAVVIRGDRPYFSVDRQEVRTDQHGHYKLPPLPAGKLTVTVIAQGWMPTLTQVDIRQGMAPLDFRLEPGKELRIRFVDQAGKAIPRVGVLVAGWRGGESLYNGRHSNLLDTHIPVEADDSGVYRWSWAPADAVTYHFDKAGGYADDEAELVANGTEHAITLPKVLRISGKVTDAAGRPVKGLTAIPVLEFEPGDLIAERESTSGPFDGSYTLEVDRADVSYRVRIEAMGYRSAISPSARAGTPDRVFDFRLEAATPVEGRIVDTGGQAIKEARVYLATSSQILRDRQDELDSGSGNQNVVTDGQGRFAFPAQFEPYTIVAVHDRGYAEVHREPTQQPGELVLKAWAHVEGRLFQAGQPVPSARVDFTPLRVLDEASAHIRDGFAARTDRDGRFDFARVPPMKASVKAELSVWRDYAITSSQSVPLDLHPGEHAHLALGGQGTVVKGRVVISGDAAAQIDLHKSLNWLLRRAPGIEVPDGLRSSKLNTRDGWNNGWTATAEGLKFLETLHNYVVVLDRDGRFQISGVPAGDYDLALNLYEAPGDGCLVNLVGSRVVRFQITRDAAQRSSFDLANILFQVHLDRTHRQADTPRR
jgi:beta-lactamase regulating signal transducer with metallopeptidase domain